ncbi:MAG: methyltransferase domain-containing protein [Balneolaceae bacterium]|nr:methyltransferase domain-containing protein [Balneolaceae bacterium]
MKPDLQRRVQQYGWDKAAPYYDNGWQEQLWPAQERLLASTNIRTGDTVLDVSCGSGLVTLPIAETVTSAGSVTGIDLSEGMLEKARSRTKKLDFSHITYKHMDAENLEFEDHSFDAVVCSLGLMYFPYPEKALHEMYRVVKKGANVSTLVWGARKECGWASIFPIVDKRVNSDVCPLFFQLGTGNALFEAYKKTGFQDISTDRFSTYLSFDNDEEACVAAFWGGAVALAYQKFDQQTREEANQEYLDSIQKFNTGEGYEIPGEFVIVRGSK